MMILKNKYKTADDIRLLIGSTILLTYPSGSCWNKLKDVMAAEDYDGAERIILKLEHDMVIVYNADTMCLYDVGSMI